ncbi:ORF86 [Leucania separata nucleopolyhedrovirus]|uniref:ORF86 n=1 Tax=Leucania separata nucleopolyhedrovirus TaxID=1307956 RepID=Q0IL33_NPVLS|nr:ORF86 [Leucania separata nucleopolyhedrovirus]AAR28850.1 ORF86 [Leucania separata nucleopolyhedrovirus]
MKKVVKFNHNKEHDQTAAIVNTLNAYALSLADRVSCHDCAASVATDLNAKTPATDVLIDWYFKCKKYKILKQVFCEACAKIEAAKSTDPDVRYVNLPSTADNLKALLDDIGNAGKLELPETNGSFEKYLNRVRNELDGIEIEIKPSFLIKSDCGHVLKASYIEYYKIIKYIVKFVANFFTSSTKHTLADYKELAEKIVDLIESVLNDFVFDANSPTKMWAVKRTALAAAANLNDPLAALEHLDAELGELCEQISQRVTTAANAADEQALLDIIKTSLTDHHHQEPPSSDKPSESIFTNSRALAEYDCRNFFY